MKRTYLFLVIICFQLLSSGFLFAQEVNYDAVYIQLTKSYTLNSDGSIDYRYIKQQKLQTYRAFQSLYGETFITFNPAFQTLKINDVYTIQQDGKKVTAPKNSFNEVLPGFAANAPAYNNLREMVITHTGLERNATVNLDYQIHSIGFYPALMGNELLAEPDPIRDLKIILRISEGQKLQFKLLNSDVKPIMTKESGFEVFTWDFLNVPAISTEEFQKGGNELYPRLLFSTAKDRESVYTGFEEQFAIRNSQFAEMTNTVKEWIEGNTGSIDIMQRLQEKVVNEFRLWPIPLRYTGFKCRKVEETWKSNGGTLSEKAILLITLLNCAGIQADPVILVRKAWLDEKIGSLMDIEDILVRAEIPAQEPVLLSVSTMNPQDLKFGLPEKTLVVLKSGKKPEIIRVEEYKNKIELQGTLTINNNKQLSGDIAVTLNNNFNPWLVLIKDKNKSKNYISGGITSSDLKELKTSEFTRNESAFNWTIAKEKPFHKDTNYYFFSLPVISNGIDSWGISLLSKSRATSIEIPSAAEESYTITIALPDGLKLFSPLDQKEISNNAGSFNFEIRQKGSLVEVKRSVKLEKRNIEPYFYSEFKALLDYWNSINYRRIIFTE